MIYVDSIRVWPTGIRCFKRGSCHMAADTAAELHAFAARLHMRRDWFQDRELPHYDLTPEKRALAVRRGAVELSGRPLLAKWRELKDRRRHEQASLQAPDPAQGEQDGRVRRQKVARLPRDVQG